MFDRSSARARRGSAKSAEVTQQRRAKRENGGIPLPRQSRAICQGAARRSRSWPDRRRRSILARQLAARGGAKMSRVKCTRTVLAVAFAFAAGSAAAEKLEPEVHIGATLPLTGAEAASGGRVRDGYQLALDQANDKGGVLVGARRLQVRLDIVDDGSDPRKAVKLLEQLGEKDSGD